MNVLALNLALQRAYPYGSLARERSAFREVRSINVNAMVYLRRFKSEVQQGSIDGMAE